MPDRGFRIYNPEGKRVNEIPLRTEKYGADRMMYHRQDLHECLKRAATATNRPGEPVRLRVSSKVIKCDCETGVVALDGGEEVEGHLVIGADGIHSIVRRFVVDEDVHPIPTGLSAYRMVIPSDVLEAQAPGFCEHIQPREPYTSMMMAHQCRLIMGPARDGGIFSIVGLVPDEQMNEDPDSKQSWVAKGDLDKMLETFAEFPAWAKAPFALAKDIGLWQLRDIDPLKKWSRGRTVLIGDAAHAMLPTQGQGASQTVEDAEALGAFFEHMEDTPSAEEIERVLQEVFSVRYERASLIQRYSRDAAKPATDKGSNEVKM